MNKSYILTALGVVGSSLLTINANADTIYMCKTCKAGTYANNNKCETCPEDSVCIDGTRRILEWEWFDSETMTVKACREAVVPVHYSSNTFNCGGGSNICNNFYRKGGCEDNKENYTYLGNNTLLFKTSFKDSYIVKEVNGLVCDNQEAVCDRNTGKISYRYFHSTF